MKRVETVEQADGKWTFKVIEDERVLQQMDGWLSETMARIAGLQAAGSMGQLRSHRVGGGYR